MANGTVGVQQATSPDRLIDNEATSVGGQTVYRQRVDLVPARVSTYFSGASGSVTVGTGFEIVAVACHVASGGSAGSLTIGGGSSVPVPAGTQFADSLADAPIVGIGAGSVVFTGTDSYYVRVRPVVA